MSNTAEEGIRVADEARAELYDTLAQLRERLDYAQRIDDATDRMTARIAAVRKQRPLAYAAGVAVIAAGVGAVVWGVAKRVARAFD